MTPISLVFVDPDAEDCAFWIQRLTFISTEYIITTTRNGRDALSMCRFRKFDCVVLEVVLPDISGLEVLSNLCPIALHPAVAVVILTKLVFTTLPVVAIANGAQAYLVKSKTSGDQLDLVIRNAIATLGPSRQESSQ